MNHRDHLHNLIKAHSVRVLPPGQEFELASGAKSRVYCDLKKTVLRADAHPSLGILINAAAEEFQPQAFAGVALGGCHLASAAALYAGFPTIFVRKEAKSHGTQNHIEAPELPKDTRVVLLEDVTTTAKSAKRAYQLLHDNSVNVVGIVTVVDRRPLTSPEEDAVRLKYLYWLGDFLTLDERAAI